ncbi:GAF domain-containing sensor histidine kinase [Deinococcus roseus]|uniref:Oxygen sensor histidine kinase NreB n=1 Tax=Deinococcus roseus TaxID=392414 RepID=A0ABQ2DIY6_9DEIO|nr:GAF domain-containing sensor histidine kinase [Deinococcus roseus]GGJ57859.1 sensor histidine kinase [Deinococcus roseus]
MTMKPLDFLHPASEPEQLSRSVRLARNVMPPLILILVLGFETLMRLWVEPHATIARLLFYGGVGPITTYFTIAWILEGIKVRARMELEQARLYKELDTVQVLIKRLAEASDLEEVLDVAARGLVQASGAKSGMLILSGNVYRVVEEDGSLHSNPGIFPRDIPRVIEHRGAEQGILIAVPFYSSGTLVGGAYLKFDLEMSSEQRTLVEALSGEVGTAIEAAQQRTRDLMTLYQVDESIRAERNMNRLLESVLTRMMERSAAEAGFAYLMDQDGVLRLVWARDFAGRTHQGGAVSTFAREVAEARIPLMTTDAPAQTMLPEASHAIGVPMLEGEHLEGVLVLAYQHNAPLEGPGVQLLALMGNQATLAVRNARAYLYSEELAINEERNRIAREIHDGIAQSLAFTAIKLDLAERLLEKDLEKARSEIVLSKQTLREQIKEVRRSIFALRPIDLERFGLTETVKKYVTDFGEQHNILTDLNVQGEVQLSPSDEAVIFRILQESLNNVAKHSQARRVWVSLLAGATVTLMVGDDGKGFDPAQVGERVTTAGGLGLKQMGERIEARGGTHHIESQLGEGTTVTVTLPAQ